MSVLLARAEEHLDWPMPGYTHLQRAQPVYLSHHLLAYFWMLARDRDALRVRRAPGRAAAARRGRPRGRQLRHRSPAGRGASSGSRRSLRTRSTRSRGGTSSSTISRRPRPAPPTSRASGAELVLWSSSEFGFCELPDAWSSGSSIMPQKKNPDAAELLRAKAPRVVGHLVGVPRRAPRAAAHLQQGPAGGQGAPVRRGRHARAVARRRGGA